MYAKGRARQIHPKPARNMKSRFCLSYSAPASGVSVWRAKRPWNAGGISGLCPHPRHYERPFKLSILFKPPPHPSSPPQPNTRYWREIFMRVTICIGSACHLKGSREIIAQLQQLVKENHLESKVDLNGSFCSGNCVNGVCVTVDGQLFSLKPEDTKEFFDKEIVGRL